MLIGYAKNLMTQLFESSILWPVTDFKRETGVIKLR